MALPNINTYYVNEEEIALYWKASPKSDIKQWKVYGSATAPININDPAKGVDLSGFTAIDGAIIANRDVELTPGSVFVKFSRDDLGIGPQDTYYFLITSIDKNDVESAQEKDNLHAVPLADDYYVDEAGQPTNIVYKSFEFNIAATSTFDQDRYLNMINLLGRAAKEVHMKCDSGTSFKVRVNSFNSDDITILATDRPFILERGGLEITKLYISSDGSASDVRIFVSA